MIGRLYSRRWDNHNYDEDLRRCAEKFKFITFWIWLRLAVTKNHRYARIVVQVNWSNILFGWLLSGVCERIDTCIFRRKRTTSNIPYTRFTKCVERMRAYIAAYGVFLESLWHTSEAVTSQTSRVRMWVWVNVLVKMREHAWTDYRTRGSKNNELVEGFTYTA